ncbi:MAG: copper chaperone PCu(A)C [Rhizobiales bacterium]|nr:copper chaperone PCu(A)C [Hyphomicrobiales bacterium]
MRLAQANPHAGHGAAAPAAAPAADARSYKLGSLEIVGPWTRATPGGATVAGGFMRITNRGATPDRLVGGAFDLSKKFEVHEMTMDNGVMKMRPVEGGLEIKPGATVELKPGSYHVMMIDLTSGIRQGPPVKGALQFEKAGKVDIEFDVAPVGAAAPPAGGMKR